MKLLQTSLAGRVAVAIVAAAVASVALALLLTRWLPPVLAGLTALLIAAPLIAWLSSSTTRPWSKVVQALREGITSQRDHDFSVSNGHSRQDEFAELVAAYNSLGDLLRRERLNLHQRELLLDTVIQTTPLGLVLTNAGGRVVYSNIAARQLMLGGRKLEGLAFADVIAPAPAPLREALGGEADTLFTMELSGEQQVFHLSQRRFFLNAQPHRLVLLKQLTRELAAQEVAVWKKVIRVIAHELNNSLAPISSLAHSGQLLARDPDTAQLERVFSTIENRAVHLASFIDGYARFAKLPRPRVGTVDWKQFLGRLEGTPFRLEGAPPSAPATFDATQLEQVMINLLKNARESGSAPEEITVSVRNRHESCVIEIRDRGSGLTDDVARDALLPFFSTKATGSGLGLTLCREIVEAHGGRLSLANRQGGGVSVTVWLPQPSAS